MKFSSDFLSDAIDRAVFDEIVSHGRWSVRHRMVFEHEGRFYEARYGVPATECQDEDPFYGDEIECPEVRLVERTVKVWEPSEHSSKDSSHG